MTVEDENQRAGGDGAAATGEEAEATGAGAPGDTATTPRPRPPASTGVGGDDLAATLLGYVILLGAPFYFFVWRNLPLSYPGKWIAVGTGVALLVAIYVLAKKKSWDAVADLIHKQGRFATDLIFFVVLALGVTLMAIYFAEEEQVFLFKVFTILYFSLLPALLYIQFVSTKARSLYDEYVINLFQLGIDDIANLPRPPRSSRFYGEWCRAQQERGAALVSAEQGLRAVRSPAADEVEDARGEPNVYKRKFEALYGGVGTREGAGHASALVSLKSENILQVALATLIIAVGWILVVDPETFFNRSFTPEDFELAGVPEIPLQTFSFAFLGAYFYTLQMLARRYFQNDLKTSAYLNATLRIVITILLVWVLDLVLSDELSANDLSALAFVVGVFPNAGWQALQVALRWPAKFVVPSLRQNYPLSDLDGLNIWYESRLLEEGIEDMQNLATANLVDVMLHTRIPVERLVDWVDQALLYLRVDGSKKKNGLSDRAKLRRYGVRTATDLQDVFKYADAGRGGEEFRSGLESVLATPDDPTSALRSVLASLQTERNLWHVRKWKSFRPKDPPLASLNGGARRENIRSETGSPPPRTGPHSRSSA